jgi:hypothetical protein
VIGERCKLDFRVENAPARLAEEMAHAISHGWEGLVLTRRFLVQGCELSFG